MSVTQLSGGKYTISIGVVEGYFEGPGQRLFNVIAGDTTLTTNFDIFAAAGGLDGDEIAQVYFRHVHSSVPQPKLALCGFTRVHLNHGETTTISLDVPAKQFRYWDTGKKQYVVEPGDYELLIGAASDDIRRTVPLKIAGP